MTCSSDLLNEKRKAIMSWAMKKKKKKEIKKHEIKITDKNGNRQCFLSASVSTLETRQR